MRRIVTASLALAVVVLGARWVAAPSSARTAYRVSSGGALVAERPHPWRTRRQPDRLHRPSDRLHRKRAPLRYSTASWFDDAGATACGTHVRLGVAHKTLPCGTKVEFHYNHRVIVATVEDRGPFVSGREWDLNQGSAAALGFTGVDTVGWRIVR